MANENLLKVVDISKDFTTEGTFSFGGGHRVIHAVDHVTFDLRESETLGILGESGCGKTTLGRTILLITRPTSGQIMLMGKELTNLPDSELREMRRHMGIVFQDPISSLDPRMTVRDIIVEPLEIHDYPRAEAKELVKQAGLEVKMTERELDR